MAYMPLGFFASVKKFFSKFFVTDTAEAQASWIVYSAPLAAGNLFLFRQSGSSTNTYYTSTDGVSWTSRTKPTTTSVRQGTSTGTAIVISESGNVTYRTTNGSTWTAATIPNFTRDWGLAASGNRIIACGDQTSNNFTDSYDGGASWNTLSTWHAVALTRMYTDGTLWSAFHGTTRYSTNSSYSYTTGTIPFVVSNIEIKVAAGPGQWIMTAQSSSNYAISTNGITWTSYAYTNCQDQGVGVFEGFYYMTIPSSFGNEIASVIRSADGVNWISSPVSSSVIKKGNSAAFTKSAMVFGAAGYTSGTTGTQVIRGAK